MGERVIAIDGPAGSGKSTTARAVAARLGLPHVESGALYRALTLAALDSGTAFTGQRLVALALTLPVRLDLTAGGFRPEVAGADVSGPIRNERVTARVSELSAIPEVREWANAEVRAAATRHPRGAVLDGRDIGTVVFPEAAVKIFLTATAEERARRRLTQEGKDPDPALIAQEAADLTRRDDADRTRSVSPLVPAADARIIDTTSLTFDEQVELVVELAGRRRLA
jgi:CMP/dCMP kinase